VVNPDDLLAAARLLAAALGPNVPPQTVNSLPNRSQAVHTENLIFSWGYRVIDGILLCVVVVVWEYFKGWDQVRVLYTTPPRRHAPCCRIIIYRRRTENGEKRFHHPRPCSTSTWYLFLFLRVAGLHTRMKHTTFKEWLAQRDEDYLTPDRPPLMGLPRINTTPFTDAQRKKFQPQKVKSIKPFSQTVPKVKEIVPNKMIPKLKPLRIAAKRPS
jgi:hypothetical protein